MKTWIDINPTYYTYDVPEYSGNPLIEAIAPAPSGRKEALLRLMQKPHFKISERELPDAVRMTLPVRLSYFFFPMGHHLRILNRFYSQIFSGYVPRNPLTCEGQSLLYNASDVMAGIPNRLPLSRPGTIMMITGPSGMGKSTLVKAMAASLGKAVIQHSCYRGVAFTEKQILYLMRNVPDQCSARSLCSSLCVQAALLTEQPYILKRARSHTLRRGEAVDLLSQIVANSHVGALIIDELHNLSLAHSGGAAEVLAMILNLCDELGVPLILIGTYKAAKLLAGNAAIAQRMTVMGYHDLERPLSCNDPDWISLCKIAWTYQWVKDPVPWDDNINVALYECSQGITRIMLFVFIAAQMEAIENGIERVDHDLLKAVFQNRFRPLHPIIDALQSGKRQFLDNYDDLYAKAFAVLEQDTALSRIETIQRAIERSTQKTLGMVDSPQTPSDVVDAEGHGAAAEKKKPDVSLLAAAMAESQKPSTIGI